MSVSRQRGFIEQILFGPFVFAIVLLVVVRVAKKEEPPPDGPHMVPIKEEIQKNGAGEVN